MHRWAIAQSRSVPVALGMLALWLVGWLGGCAQPPAGTPATAAAPMRSALPPIVAPPDNPMTPEKAALGKQLFVDTRLSGSQRSSCQSCHYRHLGWTDAQVLSRRDNGDMNTRHTPSVYNVGHQTIWYWDGRSATLEAQILAAWRNQMSVDPAVAAARIAAVPGYASQFQAVFGGPATPDAIVKALATYLRTKNSDHSPWDRYEAGDRQAVSAAAVAGHALFTGKGRCTTCHTPPHYGNSTFFNIGLEHGKANPDVGRFNVTRNEADRSAFKTPSLRSVELGAPYFHDGSVPTLKEAVRYMASGGRPDPNKTPLLQPTGLSEAELDQIVVFLNSLTSTERWEPPKLP
jgi:cytochrome c peroxidase